MFSLPKSIQDICYKNLQELYKQDILNEIDSKNMIKFYYHNRLVNFIYEYFDFVKSTISIEEFIASDDKVKFIKEYLYEIGELEEDTYQFFFPYNNNKEEVIFLLELWIPDNNYINEDDHLYYYQRMLNNHFSDYILEKIVDMLL